MHGTGKKMSGKGYKLECEFANGRTHGYGKLYYPNGNLMYEGEYRNGKRTGNGKKYY